MPKEYHRESKVQLMLEARQIPELCFALQQAQASFKDNYERFLGVCAAYVGIVLEGYYKPEELGYIEEQLVKKLRDMSVIHIDTPPVQTKVH